MILLIVALSALLFWTLSCYFEKKGFYGIMIFSTCIAVVLAFTLLIMIIAHGVIFLNAPATKARLQSEYNVIMYQVENHIYEDDLTRVAMRQLMEEIEDWNSNLASNKALQRNIWVGIFYPDIYDNFNFITL